jgi:hypothetical protein
LVGVLKEKTRHSLRSFAGFVFPSAYESRLSTLLKKQNPICHWQIGFFLLSGWQDSNLRPSGPKPDALTGLRYTPKICPVFPFFKGSANLYKLFDNAQQFYFFNILII